MSPNQITLFLTEKSAIQGAWLHNQELHTMSLDWDYRIIPATMRDRDGTVDHGFKVSITQRGEHRYFL